MFLIHTSSQKYLKFFYLPNFFLPSLKQSLHKFQFAYFSGQSTETALPKVVNNLLLSLNKDNISILAMLKFSLDIDELFYFYPSSSK